jgi:serine/threonine-protein kinase
VWSLGAILYELVSGVAAFAADGVPQICTRIMLEEPAALSSLVPDVPPELDWVIARSLQKLPDERYPTVADLALALLPFARKASHAHVETAVRIVRASSSPHGRLPEGGDSLTPPLRSDEDDVDLARPSPETKTLDLSGGPGLLTQGELKPMMASIAQAGSGRVPSRSRALFLGAVALLAVVAAWFAAPGSRRAGERAERRTATVVTSPSPSFVVALPALSTPVVPLAELSAVPSASAKVPTTPSALRPRPAVPKPQPKVAPTEPSPEELLRHR